MGQRAGDRHLQLQNVEEVGALLRLADDLHQHHEGDDRQEDLQAIVLHEARRVDHELRDRRQSRATQHVVEHLLEFRNDRHEQERRDADCGNENHDRVDHRALHLVLDLLALLGEFGETAEDDFKNAARFTCLDHVDVKMVENLRILRERLGERSAGCDVLADAVQGLDHLGILHLTLQNLNAAHQRQARVDKRRQLTGELSEDLGLDFAPHPARQLQVDVDVLVQARLLLLRSRSLRLRLRRRRLHFAERSRQKPLSPYGGNRRIAVTGLNRAPSLVTCRILRDILKCCHSV